MHAEVSDNEVRIYNGCVGYMGGVGNTNYKC